MRVLSLVATLAVATEASILPLKNGFPMPSMKDIAKIEHHAGGALPNGALPSKLTPTGKVTLDLIAAQETFEVAYFTDLLKNVTNGVKGYNPSNKKYVMRSLRRIRAQEELHALGANAILKNAGYKELGACQYTFPVNNFDSAIELADLFTSVVLSVLPAAQAQFAADGGDEAGLIPLIGSIIGQEGEQTGVFRAIQGKAPSAAPFLTGGPAEFAFTALKMFIVPGSCKDDISQIKLKSYPPLTVMGTPEAKNANQKYEVQGTVSNDMSLVYLSGQNVPLTVPISNIQKKGKTTSFSAKLPFVSEGFAKGLTYAAVVKGNKKFSSAEDVAAATVYGPGLIEIQ